MRKLPFILMFLLISFNSYSYDKKYDFEFKSMDLRKVVSSLADLDGKSVQYTKSVGATQIDVSLKNVTPSFAIKLILESYGFVAVKKGNIFHVMTEAERGPQSTPMVIIPMKHVLAEEIKPNIDVLLGNTGAVSVNQQMNALVLTVTSEQLARIRSAVEKLDQEIPQVFIQAKIIETTTTFSRALGLEWGPNVGTRNGISMSAPVGEQTLAAGLRASVGNSFKIETRISTGERNGEVKILSEPKITTLNGVPANIDSSITFNIRTLAATGSGGGGGSTTSVGDQDVSGIGAIGGVQTITAGLSLIVTPNIVSDEKVRLKIKLSKSDPDFSNRIDGIPGISDNSASTSLVVNNGQMASIGGLVSQTKSTSRTGVPFLSSIPILGYLFGNVEKEKKDIELMIFLTPKIYRASSLNGSPKKDSIQKIEQSELQEVIPIQPDDQTQAQDVFSLQRLKEAQKQGMTSDLSVDQPQLQDTFSFQRLKEAQKTGGNNSVSRTGNQIGPLKKEGSLYANPKYNNSNQNSVNFQSYFKEINSLIRKKTESESQPKN